uniref:Uncharacterized protein n=1 Tax=Arundo donax TaxID=35708 RepID=A0A0A8ZDB2_ARUDO
MCYFVIFTRTVTKQEIAKIFTDQGLQFMNTHPQDKILTINKPQIISLQAGL